MSHWGRLLYKFSYWLMGTPKLHTPHSNMSLPCGCLPGQLKARMVSGSQIASEHMQKSADYAGLEEPHTGAFIILGKANAVRGINRRITRKKMLQYQTGCLELSSLKMGKMKTVMKKTCMKCHIITIINLRITGVSEGQEREKCAESLFRDLMIENFQNSGEVWISKFMKFIGSPHISTPSASPRYNKALKLKTGTSLVVQQLRCHSQCRGPGFDS